MKKDYLEVLLNRQIEDEGLITPHRQYKFHDGRRWAFDFAWPGILGAGYFHSLAVEIDGGTWLKRGGHTTGTGFEQDREKDSAAAAHGWVVLRFTSKMVRNGEAIRHIKFALLRGGPVEVTKHGLCHPVGGTESVSTADSTSKVGGGKPVITRYVRLGKRKVSRPPTRRPRRPPRRRRALPKGASRRLPKET